MLKLFIAEQGSESLFQFAIAEDDRSKVVSALAYLEGKSAFYRQRAEGRLTFLEAEAAVAALHAELKRMVEQPLNGSVLTTADSLLERHNLRTLDSIQLASAIVVRELMAEPNMRFIASDVKLLNAAKAEGFMIWNPEAALPAI